MCSATIKGLNGVLAPLYSACTYRRWLHLLLGGAPLLPAVLLVRVLGRALGDGVGGDPFAIIPLVPRIPRWKIEPGWPASWAPLAALGSALALIYLAAGLGALLARWAPPLLGATPTEAVAALSHRATELAERNRVARELNDSVRNALTVNAVQAGAARRMLGNDPALRRCAVR